MLDAFDFFLVVFCLTAIAHDFHRSDRLIALSITLTLAFRPVGAFLFGALADRFGRRGPLMLALVFYSVIEIFSGLAPNYLTFLILRALFGIGMGGEWGVGASLAMEAAPTKKRGFLSGVLQQGYAAGYLLAAVCYAFIFPRFGWRPLFFLGGLPALLALFVRFRVKESDVWKQTAQANFKDFIQVVALHWKLFIYIALFMAGLQLTTHGTQDMYPTFLERYRHFGPADRAWISALSMIGAIAGWNTLRYLLRSVGASSNDHRRIDGRVARHSAVGVRAIRAALTGRSHRHAVSHPGRHGDRARPPLRTRPQLGARISGRVWLPVRRAPVQFRGLHRGHFGNPHKLFAWAMAETAVIVLILAIIGTAVGPERRGAAFSSDGH